MSSHGDSQWSAWPAANMAADVNKEGKKLLWHGEAIR